ncbi:type II toxin-antitoxin system CcdA family antitoxin [Sphingomonas sp. RIT328]|uniref:type II toxin-antitoxin system CcdA family antitoxin n=1 Tax=Sphingomonas sp. RIT328 TaxID=1470591 RepID=UPI0009DEA7B1|nr:type II toxin-antitoxin system CcdA family antitoxin [Sphingomonas sp. RIT328]
MAQTLELSAKSTRDMSAREIRAEAARFGISPNDDIEVLRAALKTELERRWQEENRDTIAAWNRWIEINGLPLERYRCW